MWRPTLLASACRAAPVRLCAARPPPLAALPALARPFASTPRPLFPRYYPSLQPKKATEAPVVAEAVAEGAGKPTIVVGESFEGEPRRRILRPILFASLFGFLALGFNASSSNMDVERQLDRIEGTGEGKAGVLAATFLPHREPTTRDLIAARRQEFIDATMAWYRAVESITPSSAPAFVKRMEVIVTENWLNTSEAHRTCAGIIGTCGVVFLAWRVPRWNRFMGRHFSHHPLSGKSYTMVTSVFSHRGFLHFSFNSIALYSIGTAAHNWMVWPAPEGPELPETTSRYQFIAFFLTAGVFASLTSHLLTSVVRLPRMIKALSASATAKVAPIVPSLGMSGAVYSCLIVTALAYPNASVSLILLPMFPIPIGMGVGSMLALDVAGLAFGWRVFDHAAHLGGALFGWLYFYWGKAEWNRLREGLYEADEDRRDGDERPREVDKE